MSFDLLLKPSCSGCGSTTDLYGSNCKHMTLCLTCGKTMAENRGKCFECGTTVTRLIRVQSLSFSLSYMYMFVSVHVWFSCSMRVCVLFSLGSDYLIDYDFTVQFYCVNVLQKARG